MDIEKRIDEALDGYPIEPLPPGFIARTMARAQASRQVAVGPFRPRLVDLLLALAGATLGLLFAATALGLATGRPSPWQAGVALWLRDAWAQLLPWIPAPSAAGALSLLFAAGLAVVAALAAGAVFALPAAPLRRR